MPAPVSLLRDTVALAFAPWFMSRLIYLLPALALLAACATAPEQAGLEEPAAPAAAVADEPEAIERPFPGDSVYPLLVAEFALRRGAYDTALQNYIDQARVLDDAGIARHTTHLAQFLDDDQITLEAGQLWLAREPDDLEANNTVATLLARDGQPLAAIAHMAVIARAGEQANFPSLLQNYAELDTTQRAELASALAELALEFPDDPALLLTQALAYAESGDLELAQDKLAALFAIEPDQYQALLLEARINLQTKSAKPFAHMEEVLAQDPDNDRLRLEYARLLSTTDLDAARKQFEILSAQSPGDANLLLSLALINREAGDDLIARAYLQQVLATGERGNEAHFQLAAIAERAGDSATALDHYRQIGEGRQFFSANHRIGELLLEQGHDAEAQAWYRRQRETYPQFAEQLFGLESEVLRNSGDVAGARAILNEALVSYPDSESLRYARSMLSQQQADLAGMEADLRDILSRDPDNATALNALGYTLADQTDRLDEARALVARALELQPNEPAILDSMGWIHYRQGDLEGALQYLTRAYRSFPDPEVAAHLGEVLWVSGEQEKALQVWQGALLSDPQHKVLLETLRRLQIDPDRLMSATAAPPAPAP